jgi:transcriptional regulator with XRE-family HTH domain
MKNNLGLYLKEKRINAKLSQGKVAKTLGYKSSQFVSNWERGISEPPFTILKKLSEMYKIKIDELFEVTLEHTISKLTAKLRQKLFGR